MSCACMREPDPGICPNEDEIGSANGHCRCAHYEQENQMTHFNPIPTVGSQITISAVNGEGPRITGYVVRADSNSVGIRGCGFTQFQAGQYAIEATHDSASPEPVKRPKDQASETLVALLDDPDSSVRFNAARELLDQSNRF